MSIKIGSNLASLTAQRRLGEADAALSKTFERLASGQRINRASDDAAGLAIADELNAKGRIYTQGIRNGNDGISLLNIADSAIDALTSVVVRIRELSEQSANGTYSDAQRKALDAEAQALSAEFTRITQSTSFNGLKIFDGSLGSGVRLQLGTGVAESINASIGGAIGTGSFEIASSYTATSPSSVTLGDLNGDSILDIVESDYTGRIGVRLGLGNGNFGTATYFSAETNGSYAVTLGDLNSDGFLDLVSAGSTSSGGKVSVRLGLGNGNFGNATNYSSETGVSYAVQLADLNNDGFLDLVTAGEKATSAGGAATVRLGIGNGNFGSATSYTTEFIFSFGLQLGDLNGDSVLDMITAGYGNGLGAATVRLGLGNGNFGSAASYTTEAFYTESIALGDLNGDGILDLVSAGYGISGEGSIRLGLGNGSFGNASYFSSANGKYTSVELGDLNGDGILDIVAAGYSGLEVKLGIGNGNFSASNYYELGNISARFTKLGDLNGDGVLDLTVASTAGSTTVFLGQSQDGLGSLLDFSLQTRTGALQSMGMLDRTLENLAKQRGTIGASQSRVNIAISNLQTAKENFAAAESRIRDADVAAEAANLVRTQILQQAAASVLSQANQGPQLALTLLR